MSTIEARLTSQPSALPARDGAAPRVLACLTRLATRALDAPMAAVTLVAADRQILLAATGWPGWWAEVGETPLEYSFCRRVTAQGVGLFVTDTAVHPLTASNPLVRDAGVRAYAGAPLWSRDGRCLGAFAVLDTRTRQWSSAERSLLAELAAAAALAIVQEDGARSARDGNPGIRPAGALVPLVPENHAALRLWAELQKRCVVRACAVYLAAAWLVIDVSSDVLPALGVPDVVQTVLVVLSGLGLPLVLATAWAFDLTSAGIVRTDERRRR